MYRQALNMFAACAAVAVTTSATLPLCAADGGGLILDIEAPAGRWEDGIPLGNGGAGALLWGGGDTLNVTLDRADFWHNVAPASYLAPDFTWKNLVDAVATKNDARRNSIFPAKDSTSATKLPGVRFVLKLGVGQTLKRFSLNGETASATVTVATPEGAREILAWFDDGDKLLSMRVPEGVTFADRHFVRNASFDKLGGYPEPEIAIGGGEAVYRRRRRVGADNRFDTDFEAGVRFRGASDKPDSAFWRKFNAASSVSIPDAEMQRLYDMAIYLYGAGARAGHPPLALQGLWKFWGRAPKTLGFFAIFGFNQALRQLRCSSEGAGAARRLFDGADTTGEIRFTSVWFQRKQKRRILFTFGMSCPRDHRKRQSERSPDRSGIYRTKRSSSARNHQF